MINSKDNNRITIIIPLYNTRIESFKACLESIKKQIYKDIDIIVINDNSKIDYNELIMFYQQHMKLNVIKLNTNVGPGTARKIGLEQAKGKYVFFMDSDDEFYDENALQYMIDTYKLKPNSKMVSGQIVEQKSDGTTEIKGKNFIWIFAKLFDREFLIENNINFNDARANEDVAFVTLFSLVANDYTWLEKPVYIWKYEPTSITRINGHAFYFYSIENYVNNMVWVYEECIKRDIVKSNKALNIFCSVWIRLYFYCVEILYDRDVYDANMFSGWCYKYWNKCYKYIEPNIHPDKFVANYLKLAKESSSTFTERICNISYPDFYNIITSGNPLIEEE